MRALALFAPAVLLVLCVPMLQADTIRVPSQQSTIQAGIDAAVDGDTVLVAEGSYSGTGNRDIDFTGKAIVVMSEEGPQVTIIDCQGDSLHPHQGFNFQSGEDSLSVVKGFTIKNAFVWQFPYDEGGAISCNSSSPTIEDNWIHDNTASYGAGIYCEYAPAVIRNNTITDNDAFSYGGAILCLNCSPIITANTMTNNTAGTEGGAMYLSNSDPYIDGNLIQGNTATYWNGGGIYCWYYSDPTIVDNTIDDNTAGQYGGGIYCDWYSHPHIEGNMISGNTSVLMGGGIFCSESSPSIQDNSIAGNSSRSGGGLYCEWMSSPSMIRNIITGNTASWGGGIYCYSQSSPSVTGNTLTGNITTGYGGNGAAIYCYTNCFPTVSNSVMWGDSAGPGAGEIYHDGTSYVTVTYSDIEGGWTGTGNIDADPLFVLQSKQDYRLLWQSPCIDAGHPDSLDADGTRLDMGAHFFDQNDYLTLYLTPDTTHVSKGGQLGVTYTAINRWSQSEQCWLLSQVLLPNGRALNILGPRSYTLPANYTGRVHMTHAVPVATPIATYEYRSDLSMPPSNLYDEDSFTFSVTE